ncbi:hypothetical protein HDU93_007929 [Gonapodya sp. JEL0774]|nr:hypothetical protein HDU93_007929 [Gonapodya sp. JEL0774]
MLLVGAGTIDYDQRLHYDYGNHTLVVPRPDKKYRHITTWLLLSDVTEHDAPTKIVSKLDSQHIPISRRILEKGELADKEVAVTGKAGSLMIYRTDVLHRGSAFSGPPGVNRSRFVFAADFKPRRASPWAGKHAWPDYTGNPRWNDWMAGLTLRERDLFGFPDVNSDYWDEQTVRDVGLRYPKMDMSPYKEALARRSGSMATGAQL